MYADKTIELCVPDDFVCSSGRDFNAHTQYVETGLVDEAAVFAAARIALATPPPAANPLSPIPTGQPHLQRSPETIDSCATECRVVGPE
jgi:cutinase